MSSDSEARALLDAQPTKVLIDSLLTLEASGPASEHHIARAWILQTLEARYPQADAALDAWAEDLDSTATYTETLLSVIPPEDYA
jgi:hypothetical protein